MSRMHKIVAAGALSAAVAVTGALAPAAAQAKNPYKIVVTAKDPEVTYFSSFTYDALTVKGPDRSLARAITKKVRAFTSPRVSEFRTPDAKMIKYLQKAQPANFSARATPTKGCHRHYVCLSQVMVFSTPLLVGSVTDVIARGWSTKTGKAAALSDFVTRAELPAFTAKVKQAIRKAPCYDGFEIDLAPEYSSFVNWVPLQDGVGVWFPEYMYGCQIMSLRVAWP